MAITKRDWWMLGIGAGVSFFIFSTLGRRTIMAAGGMGKAEIERALSKVEKRTKKRKILEED